ncbi:MAG: biopolymer transporter ExbD [Gammaproteobacteria bacterium]
MNLRKVRRESPAIDLTPLIDVVFMLLIFFMVSSTFKDQSMIRIDLPKASQQKQQENQEKPIVLTIDAQGNFYVDDKRVVNTQIDTLKRALKIAIDDRKSPPLTISADGRTPHQAVVTAMDAARQVGLVHLLIATKNAPEGKR